MKPLDGEPVTVGPDDDPRQKLADWMTTPTNPFFARAVANRYWAHFFGRGIVDPLDDMRVTNPPSNPELLDALANDFVKNHYSLKHLVKHDRQEPDLPAQLDAERVQPARQAELRSLLSAAHERGGAVRRGQPGGRQPGDVQRAADGSLRSEAGDHAAGRVVPVVLPGRVRPAAADQRCECERVSEANLAQALHLLNSDEIQNKLARPGGRAELMAKDTRPDPDKVDELFLWALGRKPTPEQRDLAMAHIAKNAANKKTAYENILWALLNTKEFVFNK